MLRQIPVAAGMKNLLFWLIVFLASAAGYKQHGVDPHSFVSPYDLSTRKNGEFRTQTTNKRGVTVSDAIRMTRIAGHKAMLHPSGSLSQDFALFSPDGKRFVIVTKKGSLENNSMEYSMLLYQVDEVFDHPHPRTLVSFASSSNREGINELSWLDRDTILFLGEGPGERTQLYSVNCNSGERRRLTNHPTNLLTYSVAERNGRIVYAAEVSLAQLKSDPISGFHVYGESLPDILNGHLTNTVDSELFAIDTGAEHPARLKISNRFPGSPVFLSPDGRYLVVQTNVTELPGFWREYRDRQGYLNRMFHLQIRDGAPTWVRRYDLIDVQTGESRVLVNGPVSSWTGSEITWLPDSRSVIVTGVFLPLDIPESAEREARKTDPATIEVTVPTFDITRITPQDSKVVKWDSRTQTLQLKSRKSTVPHIDSYHRRVDGWELVDGASALETSSELQVSTEQDLNTPPQIIVRNSATGRRASLLDLNPQFKELTFGRVEVIKWPVGDDARIVEGCLYLPPDYVPGRRYPLVIQTHGFSPNEFWIDGPFFTADAAQPLASKGLIVLQVPDEQDFRFSGTPEEAPRMMQNYEGAIDYLQGKGMIDPNRVGIVGFSHTCWLVKYTLTHSKYHFAAAVSADGLDGGYFQYLAFANQTEFAESFREKIIGAPPFGDGLALWLKRSPGFQLDKVQTPVLIQAIGTHSLMGEWEWFAGLLRLNKAVDLVYIPDGFHILQKPSERLISQQATVEWFCFWLKGEENTDPGKAGQYAHWRKLRTLEATHDGSHAQESHSQIQECD